MLFLNRDTNEIFYSNNSSTTSKTFIIQHPQYEDKYLVHACLEGPEAGVFYRGRGIITNNKNITINLPSYVDKIATDFTINITSIDNNNIYKSTDVYNNSFDVYGLNGSFDWIVYGKRLDLEVEPSKKEYILYGDGPYSWVKKK
jgi:hypothetical protein